ncbi:MULTISPECIES: hypothetical protein [unclassified Ochrobactrum]|uniref:hypothetical protein n=1 Tax=unclassified Ochrobactrum TaxID=239106 RepID=UPI0015E87744|nr:hypothetical protein [Ochrobactrum sp. POC9]MCH4540128.1 hypothetical protein [Ochrobactrum sp. A-1]
MDNHQFRDCKRHVGASEAFDDISIVSVSNPTAGLRQKTPQIRHAHHFATSRPPMQLCARLQPDGKAVSKIAPVK